MAGGNSCYGGQGPESRWLVFSSCLHAVVVCPLPCFPPSLFAGPRSTAVSFAAVPPLLTRARAARRSALPWWPACRRRRCPATGGRDAQPRCHVLNSSEPQSGQASSLCIAWCTCIACAGPRTPCPRSVHLSVTACWQLSHALVTLLTLPTPVPLPEPPTCPAQGVHGDLRSVAGLARRRGPHARQPAARAQRQHGVRGVRVQGRAGPGAGGRKPIPNAVLGCGTQLSTPVPCSGALA